jgi:hypothetical protein
MKCRKGALDVSSLAPLVIMFGLVAIIISVGGSILAQVQTQQTANSVAYNASTNGLSGITTMAAWLPTIAVVIAAAVVIGIIISHFRQG